MKLQTRNKEIDKYCTLCMDINCVGCPYEKTHFRDMKWVVEWIDNERGR